MVWCEAFLGNRFLGSIGLRLLAVCFFSWSFTIDLQLHPSKATIATINGYLVAAFNCLSHSRFHPPWFLLLCFAPLCHFITLSFLPLLTRGYIKRYMWTTSQVRELCNFGWPLHSRPEGTIPVDPVTLSRTLLDCQGFHACCLPRPRTSFQFTAQLPTQCLGL